MYQITVIINDIPAAKTSTPKIPAKIAQYDGCRYCFYSDGETMDTRYISHDLLARDDTRVILLTSKYGARGYGLLWLLIETLFDSDGQMERSAAITLTARYANEGTGEVNEVVNQCLEIGLVSQDGNMLYSAELLELIKRVNDIREARKLAGSIGGQANAKQMLSNCLPNAKQMLSKCLSSNDDNELAESEGLAEDLEGDNIYNIYTIHTNKKNKKNNIYTIPTRETKIEPVPEEKPAEKPNPEREKLRKESERFAAWFKTLLPSKQKVTEGMINGWRDTYEKLRRIDGRTPKEIKSVCEWARKDEFWSKNFLSATKLRNKNKDGVYYYDVFLNKTPSAQTPRTFAEEQQEFERRKIVI